MKIKKILLCVVLFTIGIILTGCAREDLVYESDKVMLKFSVIDDYELSSDKEYFRNAREERILLGKSFRIGIEFNNDLEKENISFNEFKNKYKDKEDYKEVKYSKISGIEFYTPEYLRYEIYLPINNKLILRLNIYSLKDSKESTKEVLNSKELKDILNHIKIKAK